MQEAEAGEDQAAQGRDRRMMPRCAVDGEAVLLLVSRGQRMPCRIVELSLSGCRMSVGERLLAGSGTRVEATFKVQGIAFRFGGEIEWADDENLVGIRFVDLIPRRRDELIEVLCELEAEAAAKQEKEAAEKRAAEERASQESEKQAAEQTEALPFLAQLWAAPVEIKVKQAPDPVAAPQLAASVLKPAAKPIPAALPLAVPSQAPAPQPPGMGRTSQPPARASKRERRMQSRHEVDTSAVIFLVNVGSKLSGRILDLSAGGCRIRTDERFPVGIYTRVETEFLLEGLPIRLGGVIQSLHDRDRHLVGIRFLDMSARKRELLGQLIEEIEELQEGKNRAKPGESGTAPVAGHGPGNAPQVPVAS
jgi:c-di-GMP-binding flagellar brake protein YcgR